MANKSVYDTKVLGTLLFLCVLGVPLRECVAANAPHGLDVAFSIPKTTVTFHEPIYMLLTARNESPVGAVLYLGENGTANFRFVIVDPDGKTQTTKPVGASGFGSTGRVSVAPGSTFTTTSILNQWHSFNEVGAYQISAELLSSPGPFDRGIATTWLSVPLHLEILPRNPARLEEVCSKLTDTALSSPDFGKKAFAALALSYVEDPVALPYLARLLDADDALSFTALRGFVRIGTPQAVKILDSNLAASKNPLLRSQIEGALTEIRTGIHPSVVD